MITKRNKSFVFDYFGGKLVVPPNGYCALNSYLNLVKYNTSDCEDIIANWKHRHNKD